jgi:hypothetical protein
MDAVRETEAMHLPHQSMDFFKKSKLTERKYKKQFFFLLNMVPSVFQYKGLQLWNSL